MGHRKVTLVQVLSFVYEMDDDSSGIALSSIRIKIKQKWGDFPQFYPQIYPHFLGKCDPTQRWTSIVGQVGGVVT